MSDSAYTTDVFKEKFKYYKAKRHPPSLQEVVRLQCSHEKISEEVFDGQLHDDKRNNLLGLKDLKEWKLLSVRGHPGLICIQNPFTNLGQRYWIRKCLEDYTKKPNKSNVDIEINDWWNHCYRDNAVDRSLQKKMRWVTLGYHHNWDTKVYSEEQRGCFPNELAELCDVIANYVGFYNFRAEAAIINYYHMDSTLSPHTDHSEINLDAPLLSFSFGQSALFLIGGTEKSIAPSALLLESGDIIIMSKEARLCYHAVPKILTANEMRWNVSTASESWDEDILERKCNFKYITDSNCLKDIMNKNKDKNEWHKFNSYINESRINMNVRQVLNITQKSL